MRNLMLVCLLAVPLASTATGVEPTLVDRGTGDQNILRMDRDVLWSEPPNLNGRSVSSEIIDSYGLASEVANDFVLEDGVRITRARWWGAYWSSPDEPDEFVLSFNLTFLEDAGCEPGRIIAQYATPDNAHESLIYVQPDGTPIYEYWADLTPPLNLCPGAHWFMVQADHPLLPQWGRLETEYVLNCESVFRSEYFSFPDWVPVGYVIGEPYDASQEFEGDYWTPSQHYAVMGLGGPQGDYGYSMVQTSQYAWFAIAGKTETWTAGGSDVLITEVNGHGLVDWTTVLGGPADDVALDISAGWGSEVTLTGYTESFGAGAGDVLVANASDGQPGRIITLGGPGWDVGESISGTAIVGTTRSFGAGGSDVFFLEKDGPYWYPWTLGGAEDEEGHSIIEVGGGSACVFTGSTQSFGYGGQDVLLSQVDWFLERHDWTTVLGGAGSDVGQSVIQLWSPDDGDLVVTGWTNSFGEGGRDLFLSRLSPSGIPVWTRTLGLGGNEEGTEVVEVCITLDPTTYGLVVTGHTDALGDGEQLLLSLFDESGNHRWTRVLDAGGLTRGVGVEPAINNPGEWLATLFVTGHTDGLGAGQSDVLFANFDIQGWTCEGDRVEPTVRSWEPAWEQEEPEFTSWYEEVTIGEYDAEVSHPIPTKTVLCECPADDGTRACCFADGSCQILSESECVDAFGTWHPDCYSCDPNPCLLPPQACCFTDGHCEFVTPDECNGTPWGEGTVCDPNPCPPPSGECDHMETDLWEFGHTNATYDGTWVATYSTDDSHSPVRSMRTSLHGGGYAGHDADNAYATRTFSISDRDSVDSISVWYNSMGVTGSPWLMAACCIHVHALDAGQEELDSQIYCVLAFDDHNEDWENMPDWIYQEGRPDEYEAGAPGYSRQGDGSIQPPPGWWYKLEVSPRTDLIVDWSQVEYLKVDVVARGVFLADNTIGMFWDDFCINGETTAIVHWANHNVGNCVLTVTDQGILGFMNETRQEGSGFIYPADGVNQLYIGSLWVGESEAYVANRDYDFEPIKEWVVSSIPPGYVSVNESGWISGDGDSDQDIHTCYTDSGAEEPRGLFVDQESWAYAAPDAADDLVIINYKVRNDGATAMESLYVGCFLDFDIGESYANDVGSTDATRALTYMTDASGTFTGLSLLRDTAGLEPSLGNLTLIDTEMCLPYTDQTKYRLLSAAGPDYVLPDAPTPADYRVLASAGPIVLGAGKDTLIAFAIMGALSLDELQANADVAALIYQKGITDAPSPELLPPVTRLMPSLPNPFPRGTVIRFELAQPGDVHLGVYDVAGRLVRGLAGGRYTAAQHTLTWDGRDDNGSVVTSGIYFLRLDTDQGRESRRLVRLK